ncbi:MAG: anti-sigma factor antagonist [Anaerolineae bacterium]
MVAERRIRVAAIVENVPSVCDFVVEAAREAGFDDKAVHHCRLAVDEACTNVVEHGFGLLRTDQLLTVICTQRSDTFVISIEDEGPPFDPTMQPDPDRSKNLEDRKHGGWGIYFIKKLMDKVAYERDGSRNILTLTKRVPTEPLAPVADTATPAFRVVPLNPKISLIAPQGHIDRTTAKPLETEMLRQISEGRRGLIVDCTDVEYVSSAGIKMLVSVWQRARDAKGDLVLCAYSPRVRDILQVMGLDMVFTLLETVNDAMDYFKVKR